MLAKLSVDQALMKARSHAKKGEVAEAQRLYQSVLQVFAKNQRAQQGLAALNNTTQSLPQGSIDRLVGLYNQGEFSVVVEQAEALTKQYPDVFIIWNLIGASATQLGVLDKAINSFQKALLLKPDSADAYSNMGFALKEQGKLDEAVKACKKALLLKPDYANAYYNMGNALQDQGKLDEAIDAYNKAISLKPDYAKAYYNMGNALKGQNKLDAAVEVYKKYILLKPDYANAYYNLGVVLQDQGKLERAIDAYNKAISLKPDYAAAYDNMGTTLKDQGKLDEAIEAYKKSLSLEPDYPQTYNNIANALIDQGKLDEAVNTFNAALLLKPDYEAARTQKLHQQAHICDWDSIDEDRKLIPKLGTYKKSVSPFSLISLEDSARRHCLRSENYAREMFPQKPMPLPEKPLKMPERIRIGYFSSDFKKHPVSYLIAKVIKLHNRDKFEIFAYSLIGKKEDELRKQLIKSFDVFKDVSEISDKEIALLSRQDKIDIAIDLNGYTQNARSGIFAYRAAPVQINYLGFAGTMGTDFIDYIIADQYLIPTNNRKYFREKQIYLPNTFMPTDNSREFSKHFISRSEMGLPEAAFVFCCFNNNYKITDLEFDIWMRVLSKVKESVLWLRRSNQISDKNIIKAAKKRNIDASRLVFADKVPMDKHLSRYKLADLFLDTFAFNAHTTTTEALWAGLPVVTKEGQGFAARVAGSLLNAIGLPELITQNEGDYEDLIIELATNPHKLGVVIKKIDENRLSKPLFDTVLYTKHLENGYLLAYQNYYAGKVPETIIVPK